ncbi:hypothetical protein SHKM778_59570 [Streptomyces sp. KM77-8]|uniref:ABC3 transporter permease C-terminal domain-containing protein n=1 Tax=Streptomyces haneummycinicus TaxID=3074435 RepID=A0AAT9HQI5_9ACTN
MGPTTGAPTIAVDWYVSKRSVVELTSGRAPRGDGEAVLDADTADAKDVGIGDTLSVQAQPGSFRVRIVGIATFTTTNPGAALVFLDPEAAGAALLGSADLATSVSLDAAPGVTDAELKRRVAERLGDAYTVRTAAETAETAADELGGFLDVIKYVMLGFAGIAVLVGVFLIVNTFSMLIAQRTRELGLLRALGADRRQVRRSVLTEAVLLGLAGSTAGLAAGIGLALGLIRLMSSIGMNLKTTEMVVGWATPSPRTSSAWASPSSRPISQPAARRACRRWPRWRTRRSPGQDGRCGPARWWGPWWGRSARPRCWAVSWPARRRRRPRCWGSVSSSPWSRR